MKLTTQHVIVIGIIVAGIVSLAALGRDTSALIALGTLLLAGIGVIAGQNLGIRDQGNGTLSKVLSMLESQGKLLAAMQPVGAKTIDGEIVAPVEGDRPPDM